MYDGRPPGCTSPLLPPPLHRAIPLDTRALDASPPRRMAAATTDVASSAPTIGTLPHEDHDGQASPIDDWGLSIMQQTSGRRSWPLTDRDATAPAGATNAPAVTTASTAPPTSRSKPTLRRWFHKFMRWLLTPLGVLIALYALNVVAWGGMLFLLLINAAPGMCLPDTAANNFSGCSDVNAPRRKWIEIDAQILNALFCLTAFGLFPWRARDAWLLLQVTFCAGEKGTTALRRLAGVHAGWFRLPRSDELPLMLGHLDEGDARVPLPTWKVAEIVEKRAPPTQLWLLHAVVWANMANTAFQVCLCGFMWGMNRFDRPSWSTGLFIGLGCGVAGAAGLITWLQGRKVKKIEATDSYAEKA